MAWQDRAAKRSQSANRHGAAGAEFCRRIEQIDRLFERIIGIEERLNDEDNTRQILRRLRDKSNTTPPDA